MILPDRCGHPLAFSLASRPFKWQHTSMRTPASSGPTADSARLTRSRAAMTESLTSGPRSGRASDAASAAEQKRPVGRDARRHLSEPEIGPEFFSGIELDLRQHRLAILVLAARQPRERAFGEIAFGRLARLRVRRMRSAASSRYTHFAVSHCWMSTSSVPAQCVGACFGRACTSVGSAQPRRSSARSNDGSSRRYSTFKQPCATVVRSRPNMAPTSVKRHAA